MKFLKRYRKLFHFKFLFKSVFIVLWMNSQAIKKIGQIVYTQLLYFSTSQEINFKYCKSFHHKDINLNVMEQRKITGNLEVQQQGQNKINKEAPIGREVTQSPQNDSYKN